MAINFIAPNWNRTRRYTVVIYIFIHGKREGVSSIPYPKLTLIVIINRFVKWQSKMQKLCVCVSSLVLFFLLWCFNFVLTAVINTSSVYGHCAMEISTTLCVHICFVCWFDRIDQTRNFSGKRKIFQQIRVFYDKCSCILAHKMNKYKCVDVVCIVSRGFNALK